MENKENQPIPLPMQVLQLATAKLVTKPLYVAAKLKIADHLAQGPLSVEKLAQLSGAHADSLYRILRALASVGYFRESHARTFELTPLAAILKDEPGSVRGMILWFNDPAHDHAWEELLYSTQTGKPAFEKAHGKPVFEYFKTHRELSEIFNQAMSANFSNVHALVVKAYQFPGVRTLYDVGGGHGHFMKAILENNPQLKGGVFDLPHVVEGAKSSLASFKERCAFLGGSFFEKIPAGADAHIMSFILHDWSDKECISILKNCYAALPENGKIFIAENVIEPGNEPAFGKLLDIEMLAMTTGRERTREEFAALFKPSGFQLVAVHRTEGPVCLIEAKKL